MSPIIVLVSLVAGYLIGAISFTRIVSHRVAPATDVTQLETPGTLDSEEGPLVFASATVVGMKLGSKYGMLVGVLDILKVFIPAMIFKLVYDGQPYFLILALAGMVGHIWPVYYRFKGGRGMSAAYGGMLAVDPIGMLVTWLLGTILGFVLRNAFFLFLGGILLFVPWVGLVWRNWGYVLYALGVNIILYVALIPEIRADMKRRKKGMAVPFEQAIEEIPMSKGLLKMGRRMGFMKAPPAK
jgi:acyl phosphate:glycerol-3-phosphate acyltransferase